MTRRVRITDFKDKVTDLLVSAGLTENEASIVFDHLLDGELAGHPSHGFLRIPKIINDLTSQPIRELTVQKETPISVLIDGGYRTGLVVAFRGVEFALSKAGKTGVGIVGGYNNTGTLGALGYYTRRVADAGYIGFMVVASEYAMAPWGGAEAVLGTNPISFSFPTGRDPIVADLATSVWTYGDLKIAMKENRTIPKGIVLDADGNDSTDPNDADLGSQLPIAQHKGYALALSVEILGGLYVAAKAGYKAVEGTDGFLMMALKTDLFVEAAEYRKNIDLLIAEIKNSSPRPGVDEILVPGERSNRKRLANAKREYLDLPDQILSDIEDLFK